MSDQLNIFEWSVMLEIDDIMIPADTGEQWPIEYIWSVMVKIDDIMKFC